MTDELKSYEARPLFRWLAGLMCLVILVVAIGIVVLGDKGDGWALALFSFYGAYFFGTIAASGRWDSVGMRQRELAIVAQKYLSGQITLEEYGTQTKQLMGVSPKPSSKQ